MQLELDEEELRILLAWADEATGGYFGMGASFVTQAEQRLIAKLEQAYRKRPPTSIGSPRGDCPDVQRGDESNASANH